MNIPETVWDIENAIEHTEEDLRRATEARDDIPVLEEKLASLREQLRRMKRATRWDEPDGTAVPVEA